MCLCMSTRDLQGQACHDPLCVASLSSCRFLDCVQRSSESQLLRVWKVFHGIINCFLVALMIADT